MGIEILIAVAVGAAVAAAGASAVVAVGIGLAAGIGAALLFGGSSKKPQAANPDFGGGSLSSSPTYGRFGPLQNTISDKIPVAVQFGRVQVGGNVVWQSEPGDEVTQIIVLGQGEIDDVEEIRINDRPYRQFEGVDVEIRTGLKNQGACVLVTNADPDVEGVDLRGIAHLAVKLKASDDLGGGAAVTSVVRGVKCRIYNEDLHKIQHPWPSGDAVKPVNSTDVQANDGYFQVFQAPANCRLADVELGLSWQEGDQADEDNQDWSRTAKAYVQLYQASATIPTGDVVAETGRVALDDITAKNRTSEYEDYNVARFNLPPNTNLVAGQYYAVVLRTTYTKDAQRKCIHVLGDFTSSAYALPAGYLNSGVFTSMSGSTLAFRAHAYQTNAAGWNCGPYWTRNPAAIVREILLNKNWGAGKPSGDINDADFATAYAHFNGMVGDGDGKWEPRYEIDFSMDSLRPAPDQLEDMAASCLAFYVRQGNRISMRVMASGDSAHNFGDGSDLDTNNYDNIKENTFRWRIGSMDDLPNRTIVRYMEPGEKWNESTVEFGDRIDQEARDLVIPSEIFLPTVTRRTQAIRIGKYHQLADRYAAVEASWVGHLDSSHVQIGDIVKLWHKAGLYQGKEFRVTSRISNPDGTIEYVGHEHFNSLFDDTSGIRAPRRVTPTGPNIFAPLSDVTGLTLTEIAIPQGTFGQNGDGRIVSNIQIDWTAVSNDEIGRMRQHRIQYSIDGGTTYTDAIIAPASATKAVLLDVQVGKTYTIRVKTVSSEGRSSEGATASILIVGKDDPPSNVANFSVNLIGQDLVFTWDPVTDVDLQGYEIRVGDTWETGAVVDTFIVGTVYRTRNVLLGSRTYHIKAIDYSENYSTDAAEDSISVSGIADQNIVLTHREFKRIPVLLGHLDFGTLAASGDTIMTNEYNEAYNRRTIGIKTERTWDDIDALALTCDQAESNQHTDQFDQPFYGGSITYETKPIDIGEGEEVIGNLILDHRSASEGAGTVLTVEYATSDDNVTYSAYKTFELAEIVARFVKFRITLRSEDIDQYIRLTDFTVILDVPDITDEGLNVTVPATGLAIQFNVTFKLTPRTVQVTTHNTASTKVPSTADITKTGFTVYLRDKDNNLTDGRINWFSKGAGGLSS